MFDDIPIGALTNGIGVVGVVLIVFWLITSGRLHLDSEVKRIEAQHLREVEDIAHDRDEWRAEGRLKDQQIDEQGVQLRYLAEVGKTMEAILHAVHTIARSSGGSRQEEPK